MRRYRLNELPGRENRKLAQQGVAVQHQQILIACDQIIAGVGQRTGEKAVILGVAAMNGKLRFR